MSKLQNVISIKEEKTQDSDISPSIHLNEIGENTNKQILEKLLNYCIVKRELHWKTYKKFEKYKNNLIIPSIIITTISSILTFSLSVVGDIKSIIILSGSLTAISSLFQTLANTYEFSKKSDSHETASESYDQLVTKIRFELLTLKNENFINFINDKINEIKLNCKYVIPFDENYFNNDK